MEYVHYVGDPSLGNPTLDVPGMNKHGMQEDVRIQNTLSIAKLMEACWMLVAGARYQILQGKSIAALQLSGREHQDVENA